MIGDTHFPLYIVIFSKSLVIQNPPVIPFTWGSMWKESRSLRRCESPFRSKVSITSRKPHKSCLPSPPLPKRRGRPSHGNPRGWAPSPPIKALWKGIWSSSLSLSLNNPLTLQLPREEVWVWDPEKKPFTSGDVKMGIHSHRSWQVKGMTRRLLRGSGYLGYVDSNRVITSISGLYVP